MICHEKTIVFSEPPARAHSGAVDDDPWCHPGFGEGLRVLLEQAGEFVETGHSINLAEVQ